MSESAAGPVTTFDLNAVVSTVLDDTELTDPRQVAAAAAARIPAKDRLAALTLALDPYVREAMQRRRQRNPVVGARATGRSAKVAAIRNWWERAMQDRVNVGPRATDWKQLGDCGYDDLMYAASTRWEKAREVSADGDHAVCGTQRQPVAVRPDLPTDQRPTDAQAQRVGGEPGGDHHDDNIQGLLVTVGPNVPVARRSEDSSRTNGGDRVTLDQEVHAAHAGLAGGGP